MQIIRPRHHITRGWGDHIIRGWGLGGINWSNRHKTSSESKSKLLLHLKTQCVFINICIIHASSFSDKSNILYLCLSRSLSFFREILIRLRHFQRHWHNMFLFSGDIPGFTSYGHSAGLSFTSSFLLFSLISLERCCHTGTGLFTSLTGVISC